MAHRRHGRERPGQPARRVDDLHVEGATGPWRNKLTEDQDLGLRLLRAGWACDHDNRASVHQQGIPNVIRLYRQRTRWAQGNLQALAHLRHVRRMPIGWRRLEVAAYLINPILQAFVGLTFMLSVVLLVGGIAPLFGDGDWHWQLLAILVLSLGGLWLGCIARNRWTWSDRCAPSHSDGARLRRVQLDDLARAGACRWGSRVVEDHGRRPPESRSVTMPPSEWWRRGTARSW